MVESGKFFCYFTPRKNDDVVATFIGDYPCKVDEKGRIMFPSAFKKQLPESEQDRFIVKKDLFEKCLVLYPIDTWEKQNELLRSKLNAFNRDHNRFMREFYKGTAEIVLDATNRMLIPKRLLELVSVERDVVLAGQDGKIEIWAKSLYENIGSNDDEFTRLAERIMGNV